MAAYVNGKPETTKTNPESERAASTASAEWQAAHKDDAVMEPTFNDKGRQTNYVDRAEVAKVEGEGYSIVVTSDGTVRKDLIGPTPVVQPVRTPAQGQYVYTAEDQQALGKNKIRIQICPPVGEKEKASRL